MKRPAWELLLARHERRNLEAWKGAIYDLEPSDSPGSIDIKSRCNIARQLVRAGNATGRFNGGLRLMIVGSGPAGIAAALDAARYGVATYVVERNRTLSEQFAQCKCRYVHPNIYQWPKPIAERNETGIEHDKFSLYWEAGPVASACRQWRMRWADIRHSRNQIGLTRFISDTEVTFKTMEEVFEKISPDLKGREVGMVLFCGGFTENRECEGQADSAPFWANDCIAERYFGNDARKQIVCISGGGDGGIQDFLRSVSNRNILELKEWWRTHPNAPTRTQWKQLEADCLNDLRNRGYYLCPRTPGIDLMAVLIDNLGKHFPTLCAELGEFAEFAFDRADEVDSCMLLTKGAKINRAYPLNIVFLLMLIGSSESIPLKLRFNHSTARVALAANDRKEIFFNEVIASIVTDVLIVRHGVKPHRMP